ncbi:hypothetical protein BRD17_06005 [Halobacteriales archaeon SW_7_68_16]|nr:MAG: hypothetical protein BRD17_06005 [Halobacteriales archaeon SW_7_68_16]
MCRSVPTPHVTRADEIREAVRERPFVRAALAADILNRAAAARHLGFDDEAAATALGRHADRLALTDDAREVTVRMVGSVGLTDPDGTTPEEGTDPTRAALVRVGGAVVREGAGSATAVIVTGAVDTTLLATVLERREHCRRPRASRRAVTDRAVGVTRPVVAPTDSSDGRR